MIINDRFFLNSKYNFFLNVPSNLLSKTYFSWKGGNLFLKNKFYFPFVAFQFIKWCGKELFNNCSFCLARYLILQVFFQLTNSPGHFLSIPSWGQTGSGVGLHR